MFEIALKEEHLYLIFDRKNTSVKNVNLLNFSFKANDIL